MALSIRTQFELECSKSQAWAFLTDASLAVPCFPGAELGELREDGFYDGSFGVKLGPMALRFGGKFKVEPLDEGAGTLRVQALGKDTKGRGTAKSDVNCQLIEAAGRTQVTVDSNVDLSGSIAQFGRAAGMIEVISKQLLQRFASNVMSALSGLPVNRATPLAPENLTDPTRSTSSTAASSSLPPTHPSAEKQSSGQGTPGGTPVQTAPPRLTLWQKLKLWFKTW